MWLIIAQAIHQHEAVWRTHVEYECGGVNVCAHVGVRTGCLHHGVRNIEEQQDILPGLQQLPKGWASDSCHGNSLMGGS